MKNILSVVEKRIFEKPVHHPESLNEPQNAMKGELRHSFCVLLDFYKH